MSKLASGDQSLIGEQWMTTNYDVHPYQEVGRWHYEILRLSEEISGFSSSVYDSKSDNRTGYDTKEQAVAAGLAYKIRLS